MRAPSLDQRNEFTQSLCPLISMRSLLSFVHIRIISTCGPPLVNLSPLSPLWRVFDSQRPGVTGLIYCWCDFFQASDQATSSVVRCRLVIHLLSPGNWETMQRISLDYHAPHIDPRPCCRALCSTAVLCFAGSHSWSLLHLDTLQMSLWCVRRRRPKASTQDLHILSIDE